MNQNQPIYRSFVLRIWRPVDPESPGWRMAVLAPHSGERWGFTELTQLAEFIQAQIGELDSKDQTGLQNPDKGRETD